MVQASGIATVSKSRLMSQVGKVHKVCVRIDHCVSAVRAVDVLVFLWTLSCSNDITGASIQVGCCQVTPGILENCAVCPT